MLNKLNKQILLAHGVEVMAKAGGFQGTTDPLFEVTGDDVRINGCYNGIDTSQGVATLEMRKTDYMVAPSAAGEWWHGISVRGATNTIRQGLKIIRTGGDGIGIYPKLTDDHIPATNTEITDTNNCRCLYP